MDAKGGVTTPGTGSKQVTPEEEPETVDSQALRDRPLTKLGNQDDDRRHVQKTQGNRKNRHHHCPVYRARHSCHRYPIDRHLDGTWGIPGGVYEAQQTWPGTSFLSYYGTDVGTNAGVGMLDRNPSW